MAFVIATVAMAFAFVQLRTAQRTGGTPSGLQTYGQVPDFQFLAHDGTRLTPSDLAGKVWVANFIFTRCKGPCPMITGRMAEVQQALKRGKVENVKLVSVTVDPAYDTPEVLASYASAVGADPGIWKFVTGPPDQVLTAIKKGFLQSVVQAPDGETVHSSRFVVVDPQGAMRAFPDGNDPEVVQKLLMDIGDILRESPRQP